jgi:WD40 repeat protein/tRNA A-37 threonylcarbamoyl transferase component Bud32
VSTASSDRAAAIFLALSNVNPDERSRVLDERCGDDAALRREVDRLVAALDPIAGLEPASEIDSSASRLDATDRQPVVAGDALAQPTGALVGGFRVMRQIGAGATGVVYLAQQQHPSRIVALKVLRHELLASAVQRRFEIEAELLGRLQHPGIAQIYAAHPGDDRTPPFIAMELVNGPPITEFVESRQTSIRDRVELLARACDAVQHAHQRGIIHRDLKPGNILVNEEGQPKVVDFGVARPADARVTGVTMQTEVGQLVGTLVYMSPEQVAADPDGIDTRTDIHALGVILFRLLTGRLPFAHDDPPLPELARRIAQDNPPRLAMFDPALRGDLEIIVSRALAKEKERRYASAAGFAADLRRYLAGQPISAAADSAWYMVRRRLGQYRVALALSGAAMLALTAVTSYALWQRARADRTNVELQQQLATSMIERSRLLSLTGNVPNAEELAWRELFRQPDSRHAQWTLWDIYSRAPSLWARTIHETGTETVRFSPDGRYLVTGGRLDGRIRLVDVSSGQVLKTFSGPPSGTVRRVFMTADGRSIVSGSEDGSLRLWDVDSGVVRRELSKAAPGLADVAIAGSTGDVVTAGTSGVQVWSIATGQRIVDLSALVTAPSSVAVSADGRVIVVGSDQGVVTAIDVASRRVRWRAQGHDGLVFTVAIEPVHRLVVSGGVDSMIHVWTLEAGDRVRTIPSENGRVRYVSFDERGVTLAAAGLWGTKVWNLDRPSLPPRQMAQAEGVSDVDMRADGRVLVTCNAGSGQVRVWDLVADGRLDEWKSESGRVTTLALLSGGTELLTTGVNGAVSRWTPGQPTRTESWLAGSRLAGAAISDNGRWIATVGNPGEAAIRDRQDGRRLADLPGVLAARAVLFTDDDRRVWVGDADGTLRVWDWVDGRLSNERSWKPTSSEVLALLARGSSLFVAHGDYGQRIVGLHDRATGRELRRYPTNSAVFSLALTRDERLLAAGTYLGAVWMFDVASGRLLGQLSGPTAMATSLDFSPDDRLLAVTSRDGSTRLWDVVSRQWLATVAVRKPGAERVRFLPDGRRLAIAYEDGAVEIRDLQYFFRHVGGHADFQLGRLRASGETFPRADEALAWSRRVLSIAPLRPH